MLFNNFAPDYISDASRNQNVIFGIWWKHFNFNIRLPNILVTFAINVKNSFGFRFKTEVRSTALHD